MLRDWLRSLAVVVVLLVVCRQITLHGWYAPHPGYRAQVDALLDGRLALSEVPDGLIHDLAWTPDGVQQVWGLGAPLWQLPFEAIGRVVGFAPFPDRAALALWLSLALCAVIRAFRPRDVGEARPDEQRSDAGRTRATDSRALQIGAVLLTALLPAVISVVRGRIGIYEEAALYAYGAAMILLGGMLAVVRRPTAGRFLALAAFAGATGLIRPTVWFYGLGTLLVASTAFVRQRGPAALRPIAVGVVLFVAGGAALYATNARRFGSGTEFGHRLNIHSLPGNIVATRFSYPFERAGTVEATTELVGSLFDSPERRSKRGFYQTGLHRGQSALPRWREYYFTTFSWPYAPMIAAGLVLAALAWRRRGDPLARTLGVWAVLGGAPLFAFYLHAPSVSSRYQLDLAPAIAALLVVAWRACATRWPRPALGALIALWVAAVATSKITRPRTISDPIDRSAAAASTFAITRPLPAARTLPAAYERGDPLLPIWTDVHDDFLRCADAFGAPIACDAPPLPGDAIVRGHRLAGRWFVERFVVADPDDDPVCLAPAPAPPACPAPPTVRTAPAIALDSWFAPPALYLNGFGWSLETLRVPPATLFYVEDPAYVALDVVGPPGTDWSRAVRVAIGPDHLPLISAADTADGARLRFAAGRHPGLQVVFIAFGPDGELDQPQSELGLRAIRWRDQ